jgi:hypothetical protein
MESHPQIVLHLFPQNKGTLQVRVKLMELFTGDFATFVDADDYFAENDVISQCLAL